MMSKGGADAGWRWVSAEMTLATAGAGQRSVARQQLSDVKRHKQYRFYPLDGRCCGLSELFIMALLIDIPLAADEDARCRENTVMIRPKFIF
jgi:hypothetical protein